MTSLLLGVLMLVACGVMYLAHRAHRDKTPLSVVPEPELPAAPPPRPPTVRIRYQDKHGRDGAEDEKIPASQRRPTRTRTMNGRVYVYALAGEKNGVWRYRMIGEERAPSA